MPDIPDILADVSATLISALYDLSCDVHVDIPDYRSIYHGDNEPRHHREVEKIRRRLHEKRIHFAADRVFLYKDGVYSGYSDKDLKVFLAFQREVINNIIPRVKPDIIHCNDWMTGLIPALARRYEIPCLFTILNYMKKCSKGRSWSKPIWTNDPYPAYFKSTIQSYG